MLSETYIDGVLAKCVALKRGGIWAQEPMLRPSAWLGNFHDPSERLLAAILLDNFVFYAERGADRLLSSAYFRFEDDVLLGRIPEAASPKDFMDSVVFTPVEGEHPRPTDSGKALCRKLRDLIDLDDGRFLEPAEALRAALRGHPVVFVDDFIGSGQQMIKTWRRAYLDRHPHSFQEAASGHNILAVCLAMVATESSLRKIATQAPQIRVRATHVLDSGYSVEQLDAPVLTPPIVEFQRTLRGFLDRHAPSLELPDFLRNNADFAALGFHRLGLLFASQGSVPDSTLPILWAAGQGDWVQLVRKNA